MTFLAAFFIIFALGVIFALWSMREYAPFKDKTDAKTIPKERLNGKNSEPKEGRISLKGEVALKKKGEIVLSKGSK